MAYDGLITSFLGQGTIAARPATPNITPEAIAVYWATDTDALSIWAEGAWNAFTATVADDSITNAKLRDSVALSVIGRSANSTGDPADIAAAIDGEVLRRSGTTLGFGTIATGGIADGAVTLAKQANMATASVVYRKTAGSGAPEVQTLATLKTDLGLTGTNSGDQTITLTGDVTGTGTGSFATTIGSSKVATGMLQDGAVTLAKQANMATASVVYRKTAGSGAPEVQTLATLKTDLGLTGTNSGDQTITLTGDITGSGTGSFATTIGSNKVTDGMLRTSSALTVIGRATNSTGNVADIAAANDGEVLRRSGTSLGFGTVATAGLADNAVTLAKMADVATATILGRVTAATGDPEALTGTQATTLLDTFTSSLKGLAPSSGGGTTNFLRADGTWAAPPGGGGVSDGDKGDITVSGSGTVWEIEAGAVGDAELRDSAALSVIGNATNAAADPADIAAGTDGQVLRRSGTTLGFGQVATAGITDNAISNAKLDTIASARFKGRVSASTGNVEDMTGTQATSLLDVFTSSLNGLAPSSGGGTTTFLRADGTWAVPAGGSADGLGPDGDKGDITVGGTGTTLTIDANAVTDAKLRQSAGLSVIGRSTNTTGDVADIAAGTDGHVLRRSGTGLAFGTVVSAGIASGAVTLAKIQDINGHSVLGNATSSSGGVTAISASASDDLVLRRSGTTIGFGAINLASSNAVTGDLAFSNLAQGSALSVLGVTGNATADVASIAAGTDNQVLRRSGTALAFGAVNLASSDAVTGDLPFSNIAQIATSRFVGRVTASTGDIEALTGTQATTLLDAFTTSLKGVVPAGNSNKQYLRSDATWQDDIRAINFVIDGGGSTITTGIKGDIEIPFAGTIQGWTLLADQSGSIQLDLWKDTYANYPPVVGDTITASDKPLISSATKAQDLAPTGWTTTVAAGDIIRVNVDSITTCQRVTLSLRIKAD